MDSNKLKNIVEAALMAIAKPMSVEQLLKLFEDDERPSNSDVKSVLEELQQESVGRGIELTEVASGFRYQARAEYSEWLSRMWEEKPAKYSRAALETLALIAYRQPVTRAEIEDVRGVGVSSSIVKTMIEREWIRVVGHRDVPGRPALYATTKQFLDYFNMKSLDELPTLAEIKDLDELHPELDLPNPDDERLIPPPLESDEGNEEAADSELNTDSAGENDSTEDDSTAMTSSESEDGDSLPKNETSNSTIEDQDSDNQDIQELINDGSVDDEPADDELDDVHTESNSEGFYATENEITSGELSDDKTAGDIDVNDQDVSNADENR